eukprot:TRINITY_DN432_c0_g1_i1.p1 TRINITY_DN432_c0_g1~~TRINITY_DN432_c0_g1_i1.p1  ORF type:complete len:484 (+),score=130.38 TRINITY_DN432_c0_g1_i1:74-1525(+)
MLIRPLRTSLESAVSSGGSMKVGTVCRGFLACTTVIVFTALLVRYIRTPPPIAAASGRFDALDMLSLSPPIIFWLRYTDTATAGSPAFRIEFTAAPDLSVSQLRSRIFRERLFPLPEGTFQSDLVLYRSTSAGGRERLPPPSYLRDAIRTNDEIEVAVEPTDPGELSEPQPESPTGCASKADILRTTELRWADTHTSNLTRPPVPNRSVAMCLSGMHRLLPFTYAEIYRSLVVPNNADVFVFATVFSENDMQEAAKLMLSLPWIRAFRLEVHRSSHYQQLKQLFCPPLNQQPRTIAMFRKIHMCEQLVSEYEEMHGFSYKILVRSRPDFLNEKPFRYDALRTCPPNRICVHRVGLAPDRDAYIDKYGTLPECSDPRVSAMTAGCPDCCPYVTDPLAYGDRAIMHRYSQMYLHLDRYQYRGRGSDLPEHLAYQALQSLNVSDSLMEIFNNMPTLYRVAHNRLEAYLYSVGDTNDLDNAGRQIDI